MILVTGGTGLLGSHLLYYLCSSGKSVRATKRPNSDTSIVSKVFSYYCENASTLAAKIEWVEADLLDTYSLSDAMQGVTHVYHCAAMVSFEKKEQDSLMKINADGTANIVNVALEQNIHKFLHVSSIATVANGSKNKPATEDDFVELSKQNTVYSFSKYDAEREVWRASEEGLNTLIINPSVIVGGANWQKSSSNMFSKAKKGIKYYTEGATGFVDVRDVAQLMILLMNKEASQQRYIINGENATYRRFFDIMHDAFNKPRPSVKAGKMLSKTAWIIESVRCAITKSKPLITKETVQSAHKVSYYSNKKILDLLPNYNFITLENSIKDFCTFFDKNATSQ